MSAPTEDVAAQAAVQEQTPAPAPAPSSSELPAANPSNPTLAPVASHVAADSASPAAETKLSDPPAPAQEPATSSTTTTTTAENKTADEPKTTQEAVAKEPAGSIVADTKDNVEVPTPPAEPEGMLSPAPVSEPQPSTAPGKPAAAEVERSDREGAATGGPAEAEVATAGKPAVPEVGHDVKETVPASTEGSTEEKSNLSFILNKPHDLTFEERPIPEIKTPHDVLVAVNYTGICGSDVHYWLHGAIGHFVVKEPMVLGHESAGTVVQVGSAVKSLQPGDRVALEPGYPCRRCLNCMSGRYNLCPDMAFAATPPYDGTLAGFWVAPEDFCFKLPENVSLQEGAMVEPLAVGVHIVKQGGVKPGDSVVVMGAGPVGLLCAAVARAFGASKVVSVDIVQSKLDFAKKLAATHIYTSQRIAPEDNARALLEACDMPEGADVVIDASGAEPSIQAALHVVKMGGTYVQGGMGKSDITFPIMALCLKEVTAKGSFRYSSGDYKLAVQLLGSGLVDVKGLISGVVGFRDAEEAFRKVKEGQVIKMLIAGPNEKI